MSKVVVITGATDGIGLATARQLVTAGHCVVVHGRNPQKVAAVAGSLRTEYPGAHVEELVADLSNLTEAARCAETLAAREAPVDVLINNAGVFKAGDNPWVDGMDVRFVVNTLAPYLMTRRVLGSLPADGRVVNLSSAAQAPVDVEALAGRRQLSDGEAYAQSKLALTMWSRHLGRAVGPGGPVVVSVNPGSLLNTSMVREAFGSSRADVSVGADILMRAATGPEFATATGMYFDNDAGQFASPHPDALDDTKTAQVVVAVEQVLRREGHPVE